LGKPDKVFLPLTGEKERGDSGRDGRRFVGQTESEIHDGVFERERGRALGEGSVYAERWIR
jgi:hypothetical protein